MATREEMLAAVKAYVLTRRTLKEISSAELANGSRPEGSCCVNGEFYNLVEVQLVHTIDGCGDWQSLRIPNLLEGCYNYVVFGKRG